MTYPSEYSQWQSELNGVQGINWLKVILYGTAAWAALIGLGWAMWVLL